MAFRIPPILLGMLDRANFAIVYASYLVAENQVFRPERDLFDEMVNRLILPELGSPAR
jgi:capsid portal protein